MSVFYIKIDKLRCSSPFGSVGYGLIFLRILSAISLAEVSASAIMGVESASMRMYVTVGMVSEWWYRLWKRQSQNVMQKLQSRGFKLRCLPVTVVIVLFTVGIKSDKSTTITVAIIIISSFMVDVLYLFLYSP